MIKLHSSIITSIIRYVNHISNVASLICAEKGKKTLNVDHVIEALKRMNFESHIKKLTSELDLSAIEKEENASELVQQKSSQEMKDLINKQKRKVKKRKKNHDFDEDMVQEQLKLFEQSKLESLQEMNQSYYHNFLSIDNNLKSNALMTGNNKKMRLDQIEMDLFAKDQNNKQEEEDFE